MPFEDLDELLGSPAKELPFRGELLRFPDRISAESGLTLIRLAQRARATGAGGDPAAVAAGILDEGRWEAIQEEILGRPLENLFALGMTSEQITHALKTLVAWHLFGQEAAEKVYADVGNPQGPNRTTRRSKDPAPSNPGRASRGGSTTRASNGARGNPKAATPGRTSSNGGG